MSDRLEEELARIRGSKQPTLRRYVQENFRRLKAQKDAGATLREMAEALGNLGVRAANGKQPNVSSLSQAMIREERYQRSQRGGVAQPRNEPQRKHSSKLFDE